MRLAKVPVRLILMVIYQVCDAFVSWYEKWHVTSPSEE